MKHSFARTAFPFDPQPGGTVVNRIGSRFRISQLTLGWQVNVSLGQSRVGRPVKIAAARQIIPKADRDAEGREVQAWAKNRLMHCNKSID